MALPAALQHSDGVRDVLVSMIFQPLLSLAPLTAAFDLRRYLQEVVCQKRVFAVSHPDQEGQSAVPALS